MKIEMKTIHVIEAVDRALGKYDSDNIDVMINEETGKLDIMYCSDNNSFPIESDIADENDVNFDTLEEELDERSVGHVW